MDNDKLRDKLSILGEEVMYVGDSGVITHHTNKKEYINCMKQVEAKRFTKLESTMYLRN